MLMSDLGPSPDKECQCSYVSSCSREVLVVVGGGDDIDERISPDENVKDGEDHRRHLERVVHSSEIWRGS